MRLAVVPAAGRASRLGRSKALLEIAGSTVLDSLITSLQDGGVERILVVAAAGDDALVEHCHGRDLEVVVNDHPERGMLSTVLCGVESLAPALAAGGSLVLCPVDHPLIRAVTVRALLLALEASPHPIVVPTFEGRRGHPLLVDAELAPRLRALDPTVGLRSLLDLYPVTTVEVDDRHVLEDLDTWRDHAALLDSPPP